MADDTWTCDACGQESEPLDEVYLRVKGWRLYDGLNFPGTATIHKAICPECARPRQAPRAQAAKATKARRPHS